MKEQGGGHIVNTASIAGAVPCPGQMATYATTKFAVIGLSLALRAAGADHGVRVSALCPGWTDTTVLDRRGPDDLPLPPSAQGPSVRRLLADQRIGVYPAERLAADTLRGIDANRALIVAPRPARIAARVARHLPSLARRQALAATRTIRRSGGTPALPAPPAPAAPRG